MGNAGRNGSRAHVTITRTRRALWTAMARRDARAVFARVAPGPAVLLVAPVSFAVGGLLAALVGANLALSYLAVREPAACGLTPASGAFSALPGLLSGAACCGPTVLVVLGIQASGLALSAFSVLVPVSVLLLVGSLLLVGRQVAPAA